jgi:hypothetical protein
MPKFRRKMNGFSTDTAKFPRFAVKNLARFSPAPKNAGATARRAGAFLIYY